MSSGVYALIIKLNKDQAIRIGNRRMDFEKGFYIYIGSALNNLEKRIERHRKKGKKLFWHIDYLLNSKHARISEVLLLKTKSRLECKFSRIVSSIPGAISIKKFGCSDCRCKSHLYYFSELDLKKSLF